MSTLNFPDPSTSPWTAPNGVTYIWDTEGEFWDGSATGTNLDQDFLKLNAANSPVTGDLQLTKTLTVNQSLTVDQGAQVNSLTVDQNAEVSGNVGIGISDPQKSLDVIGDVRIANGQLELQGGGGNTDALQKQEVQSLIDSIDDYVEISGDNMTGDLTLGTNQITLDAADGSATFAGDVTANSFLGDGSNLSGIESGTANFLASGTIPNGAPVVINSDGTVSSIKTTTISTPIVNSPINFAVTSEPYGVVYCPDIDRVVCMYYNSSTSEVECRIGIVEENGDKIRWGSVSTFPEGTMGGLNGNNLLYDTVNNRLVFAYTKTNPGLIGRNPSICAGEIDIKNDRITWGAVSTLYNNVYGQETKAVIDTNTNQVVAVYNIGNSGGTYINTFCNVCTVIPETNTINMGPQRSLTTAWPSNMRLTFDPSNNKVVIACKAANSGHLNVILGQVSGTTFAQVGSTIIVNNSSTTNLSTTFDSSKNKVVIAFEVANETKVVVGTVSGTTATFGNTVSFPVNNQGTSLVYDDVNDVTVLAYAKQGGLGGLAARIGTIDGTSISFGNEAEVDFNTTLTASKSLNNMYSTFPSAAGKSVLFYKDTLAGNGVTFNTVSASESNLNLENYIGLAAEVISDGTNGNINIIGGINEGQSGQNVSKKYYVKSTGIISDVESYPLILAGTAISSTKMIVKG